MSDEEIVLQPGERFQSHPPEPPARVVIVGLEIPFGDLIWLLIKITFALIPAMIFVGGLIAVATFIAFQMVHGAHS